MHEILEFLSFICRVTLMITTEQKFFLVYGQYIMKTSFKLHGFFENKFISYGALGILKLKKYNIHKNDFLHNKTMRSNC